MTIVLILASAAFALNAVTWFAFWLDKQAARNGERRIAEAHLLMLALSGGSPAALLASSIHRHKTKKQPFRSILLAIVAVQAASVAILPWLSIDALLP